MSSKPQLLQPTNDYYLVEVYDPQSAESSIIRPDGYAAGLREGIIRAAGPGIQAVIETGEVVRNPLPLKPGAHVQWMPNAAVGVERGRIGDPRATYKLVRHDDIVGVFVDAEDYLSARVTASPMGGNLHCAEVEGYPEYALTGAGHAEGASLMEDTVALVLDTFTAGQDEDEDDAGVDGENPFGAEEEA